MDLLDTERSAGGEVEKWPEQPRLHWKKTAKGHWESEEGLGGLPDFAIDRFPGGIAEPYRLRIRSAKRPKWFERMADAKDHAESLRGTTAPRRPGSAPIQI